MVGGLRSFLVRLIFKWGVLDRLEFWFFVFFVNSLNAWFAIPFLEGVDVFLS